MDEISRSLLRLAERIRPAEPDGLEATFAKVRGRRRRRRLTAGVVGLSLPALAIGFAWLALRSSDAPRPLGPPTVSGAPSAAVGPCDWLTAAAAPDGYTPSMRIVEGDLDGDGGIDRVEVLTDEARPEGCRYVLRVQTSGASALVAAIAPLAWPGTAPEPLMVAEIDGRPGLEVVVELSPAAVYRPGAVFTLLDGGLARMELRGTDPADLFPLDDEFPAGVDCTTNAGAIVVTTGVFADGGADDGRWEITRTTYRARGTSFQPAATETHVVEVGTETERWPELAGEPFRGCPFVNGASDG